MKDYVTELEGLLAAAEERIAQLEAELRLWKSGAKSATLAMVEQRLGEKS